jgi:hypothetical protein
LYWKSLRYLACWKKFEKEGEEREQEEIYSGDLLTNEIDPLHMLGGPAT